MAKSAREEAAIMSLMDGWVSVSEKGTPNAFKSWMTWRRVALRCQRDDFTSLTVPTEFPPTTASAARDYVNVIRKFRGLINWNDARAQLPENPQPWAM